MTLSISTPVPGFYRRRLVKDGPWVPVRIKPWPLVNDDGEPIDREDARCFVSWPPLRCFVDGQERDVWDQWPFLHPITEAEFRYMTDTAAWARQYAPHDPTANPKRPIDINRLPPVF